MDELDELKKKKKEERKIRDFPTSKSLDFEELQKQLNQQLQEEAQLQQQIDQVEIIVKQKLTKDALSRFGNIKIAYPQKYIQSLAVLGQLIQKVNMIDDTMLKDILTKLQSKHKFKIRRK